MATYVYKALDRHNTMKYGSGRFKNEQACADYLKKSDLTSGQSVYKSETAFSRENYKIVGLKELSIFSNQMSVMFTSQITLIDGVTLIAAQTENRQLKITLNEIRMLMESGIPFAEAVSMYPHIFGSYLCSMVLIGELSGTLDITLQNMSVYFGKEHEIRKKLKSSVAYPAVLTLMMSAIVILLIAKVLPVFDGILRSMAQEIPPITGNLLGVSLFLSKYGIVILGALLAVIIALSIYVKTPSGKSIFDRLKLTLPISRFLTARIITSKFARSLAILLKSGFSLISAVEETKIIIDNEYLKPKFDAAISEIKNGQKLDKAFDAIGVFPPMFIKMLIIGQNTGHIDEMLNKAASLFEDDVNDSIERLTAMLEPALIIILSVVVGIILVSVMLPMIDIMNAIR